jgi:serine/threonine-protein kinase
MLTQGEILQERYRIVSMLGQGGMGAVYRAWDLRLNAPVALKEMMPQPGLDDETLERMKVQFRREATILANLNHPNLVNVTDFFEEKDHAYLVMRFIEGESLAGRIAREGAQSESQVLRWADQLLDALAYCHGENVLHRDIKPQNIIIRPDGRAVFVDFGLVKLWDPDDPKTSTVMRGMGTPEYAPPEQYGVRQQHTGPHSDLYSLGATLYHALTGQLPPSASERMVAPDQFMRPHQIVSGVSPQVEAAVLKAMALPRDERFATATEMRSALQPAPSSEASSAQPVGSVRGGTAVMQPGQGSRSGGGLRFSWTWAVGGLVALALLVGGGLVLSNVLRGSPATPIPESTWTSTPTESSPDDPTPTAEVARETHVVGEDETLEDIAAEYGVSVEAILALNDLEDPASIEVGLALRIPVAGSSGPATPEPEVEPTATTQSVEASPTPTATSTPSPTPTSTEVPTLPPTSTPAPVLRYQPVPLGGVANGTQGFVSPPTGSVTLGGIPFQLSERIFQSQAEPSPYNGYPVRASLSVNVSQASRLHLLLTTGNGFNGFSGQAIGRVLVTCDGDVTVLQELVLGQHVREWHGQPNVVSAAPGARQVWTGQIAGTSVDGQIDMLSLDLPDACRTGTLEAIDVVDSSAETVGSLDPALNLTGATVEYYE